MGVLTSCTWPAARRRGWLHWNGQVFHRPSDDERAPAAAPGRRRPSVTQRADAGDGAEGAWWRRALQVHKGDTLVILEAMKMELPVRSAADAVVQGGALPGG